MKAITRTKYGTPEVLSIQTLDKPTPKSKELLIRVHASTVNRTDCGILTGKPYLIRAFTGLMKPSSLIPGTDFAGEIEAVGEDVQNFKVGGRVWGFNDEGLASHAQYMLISEDKAVVKIPENISYESAAVSAEGAHYAYNFIKKIPLKAGDKVLVNGATGAIGSAAVQLLKHFGAYVTAVGNTKNMDLVKSLGADKVFDYEKEDFTKDTERYDYVCDAVGKSTFGKCKPLLKEGGVYLSSELGPNAENLYLPLLTLFSKKKTIFPIPSNCKESVLLLNQLLAEGKFKPVIDRTYPMEEVAEAYRYVESGQKTGNVLLSFE